MSFLWTENLRPKTVTVKRFTVVSPFPVSSWIKPFVRNTPTNNDLAGRVRALAVTLCRFSRTLYGYYTKKQDTSLTCYDIYRSCNELV